MLPEVTAADFFSVILDFFLYLLIIVTRRVSFLGFFLLQARVVHGELYSQSAGEHIP